MMPQSVKLIRLKSMLSINKLKSGLLKIFPVFAALSIILVMGAGQASAYTNSPLIDDNLFLDSSSMSKWQIQEFLTQRGSGLANITVRESIGYYPNYNQNVSVAQAIADAGQVYGINPRVIMATLQKEQGLITEASPEDWQLRSAMGFGCPDSGSCSDAAAGLFTQIDLGTFQLRFSMERSRGNNSYWNASIPFACPSPTRYFNTGLYAGRNVTFLDESGDAYASFLIPNGSTGSMYCYTPHAYNNPQGLYGRAPFGTTGDYYSGSYNFVTFYETWFGSTTGAIASLESVTGNSGALQFNQTRVVTVGVRNTGSVAWCNETSCTGGRLPTRLVNWGYAPFGLYDSTDSNWVSSAQIKLMNPGVQPGEVGYFSFRIRAPYINNLALSSRFVPMVGSTVFAPQATVYVGAFVYASPMTVTSQTVSPSTTILGNQTSQVTVKIRNDSIDTWYSDAARTPTQRPFRLMTPTYAASHYFNPNDISNTSWLTSSQIGMQTGTVGPGQEATFQFTIKGPFQAFPGYALRLRPVIDGLTFLPDVGINMGINTPAPNFSYEYVSGTYPTTLARNTTGTVTLTLKNTSGTVWRNETSGKLNRVRLMMSMPRYRPSKFYDSTDTRWLSSSQVSMVTPVVNPGENGVFTFNLKAPSTPGTYLEYYSLVMDGGGFFPDYGSAFQTTVN